MSKKLTLRCACGNTYTYQIGATPRFATWQDAMAHIKDEKETDKLVDAYMRVSKLMTDDGLALFSMNPAEHLTNIYYKACGETVPLFDPEVLAPITAVLFDAKITEQIAASQRKWTEVLQREGIVAFEALYMQPKTRLLSAGIFLQMRWFEDKKERVCTYTNRDSNGNALLLVDDGNVGFCYEGLPTTAKCTCGNVLTVDSVVFNK